MEKAPIIPKPDLKPVMPMSASLTWAVVLIVLATPIVVNLLERV